jgi:glucuronosyltransferase
MYDCANDNMVDKYVSLFKFANYLTNFTLQHQNVLKLMNETTEHFDLLFLEIFLDDALLGFAHHFNCPVVAMSTMGVTKWINDLVGSPQLVSHAPHLFLPFTDDMSFYERSINMVFLVMEKFMMDFLYFPQQVRNHIIII